MEIRNTSISPMKVTYRRKDKLYNQTTGEDGSPHAFDEVFIASGDLYALPPGTELLGTTGMATMEGQPSGVEVPHPTPALWSSQNTNGPSE
jgi:hypothetical protein